MGFRVPFDANTIINSLVDQSPKLAEVFNAHAMACVGCVFSRFHCLADAAAIYSLDVNHLIDELSHKYAALPDRESEEAQPFTSDPVDGMR